MMYYDDTKRIVIDDNAIKVTSYAVLQTHMLSLQISITILLTVSLLIIGRACRNLGSAEFFEQNVF